MLTGRRLAVAVICLVVGISLTAGAMLLHKQLRSDASITTEATGEQRAQQGGIEAGANAAGPAVSSDLPQAGAVTLHADGLPTAMNGKPAAPAEGLPGFRSSINPQADAAMRATAQPPILTTQANLPTMVAVQRLLDGEKLGISLAGRQQIDSAHKALQEQARQQLADNWQQQYELRNQLREVLDGRESRRIRFELAGLLRQEREAVEQLDSALRDQVKEVLSPEQAKLLAEDMAPANQKTTVGGQEIAAPFGG